MLYWLKPWVKSAARSRCLRVVLARKTTPVLRARDMVNSYELGFVLADLIVRFSIVCTLFIFAGLVLIAAHAVLSCLEYVGPGYDYLMREYILPPLFGMERAMQHWLSPENHRMVFFLREQLCFVLFFGVISYYRQNAEFRAQVQHMGHWLHDPFFYMYRNLQRIILYVPIFGDAD